MIGFLLILFVISMLFASTTGRLEAYVKIFSIQGIIFFLIILTYYSHIPLLDFLLLLIETLLVKTVVIPVILIKVIRKNNIYREVEPYIPNFFSLVISVIIFVFGFILAYLAGQYTQDIRPFYFGISISTIVVGLFIIMSRKKIITHIMGYMFLENGIFLLSLSVAREMPLIVNLGILLDIFIGVFLLVIIYNHINSTFAREKINIDSLSCLKD
ncbi:MAG: hypothetical protein KKH98_11165 [Spirochaetes bacterium]|nr:hypothetical protein [Spirochaetota bacterium]